MDSFLNIYNYESGILKVIRLLARRTDLEAASVEMIVNVPSLILSPHVVFWAISQSLAPQIAVSRNNVHHHPQSMHMGKLMCTGKCCFLRCIPGWRAYITVAFFNLSSVLLGDFSSLFDTLKKRVGLWPPTTVLINILYRH